MHYRISNVHWKWLNKVLSFSLVLLQQIVVAGYQFQHFFLGLLLFIGVLNSIFLLKLCVKHKKYSKFIFVNSATFDYRSQDFRKCFNFSVHSRQLSKSLFCQFQKSYFLPFSTVFFYFYQENVPSPTFWNNARIQVINHQIQFFQMNQLLLNFEISELFHATQPP